MDLTKLAAFFQLQYLFSIALGLIGIGFIIAFHEFGHFIFCKIFNIATPTFSIGAGPVIASKKIGETTFALSAIPFGGYVEIAIEPENANAADKHRYFNAKPYYQKLLVLSGGIFFNIIFAYIVFALLFMSGLPESPFFYPENSTTTIKSVVETSPAHKLLHPGDTIISINGQPVLDDAKALHNALQPLANKSASFLIKRATTPATQSPDFVSITLGERKIGKESIGTLGVAFEYRQVSYPFFHSIKAGFDRTNQFLAVIALSVKNLFVQRDFQQVGGPISIIYATIDHAGQGFKIFFLFLAIISLNLAVMNLIPLPVFDGGQIMTYTIEMLIRRPLPEAAKNALHIGSWLLVMLLMLYLSIRDIDRMPLVQKTKQAIARLFKK